MNSRSRLKILIAAGGSGGHIFPAVALAKRLKDRERNVDIKFVGSNRYLDKKILKKENFDFFLLSANKLPYKFTPRMALFFAKCFYFVLKVRADLYHPLPDPEAKALCCRKERCRLV